jgi:hypothetical protein
VSGTQRESKQTAVAACIGRLAQAEHPNVAALSLTSQRSSAAADFERGIDILLAGIASRSRGA